MVRRTIIILRVAVCRVVRFRDLNSEEVFSDSGFPGKGRVALDMKGNESPKAAARASVLSGEFLDNLRCGVMI